MTSRADEMKLDIDELNALLKQACRQRSKDILSLEVRRLETELAKIVEQNKIESKPGNVVPNAGPKCYEVKLKNYAWDQSDKYIKLYVTLKNVQSLPKEAVFCNFTDKSIDLHVLGLDNRNYQLPINNLCEEIDPEKSYIKVKSDMIAIFLAKTTSKNWSHVTGVEKKITEAKAPSVPSMEEDSDPGASLMNLMKKMYQDGDDEIKKTIAKAWTESQDKKASGLGDFPSL
ncbi:calcyclin-binding protein [Cephus cinctus]|uniref:Calcyclin-binding protein n=1 Tax=Cephus cinctus TaxID=211228 RepID=A0AAJ7BYX3_CEPCN|nr:calcyclin-binding protein [Cephus cinctus]